MITLTKRLMGRRPAWLLVPTFFMTGAGLVHLLMNISWTPASVLSPGETLSLAYNKVGWVSVPMAAFAIALLWATWKNFDTWRRDAHIDDMTYLILSKVASLAPQVGLLGSVTGMVIALTHNYVGLSKVEAQALMMNAIGTALYSTMVGVILSLLAKVQIPLDKERK